MAKSLTRIVIKEGIKRKKEDKYKITKPLIPSNPDEEDAIKKKIEGAIDSILAETEYERMDENPPTFGVEKDTV